MAKTEYYELLKNFKNMNFEELKKVQKETRTHDGLTVQSLIGDNYGQFTEKDVEEFFSPVSEAILDRLNQEEIFQLILDKSNSSFRCVTLKTHTTIFKFTINLNNQKAIVDAVNCQDLQHFYFAKNEEVNFERALNKVLIDLEEQIKYL